MAIALVQEGNHVIDVTTENDNTVTFPSTATANNLLIAGVQVRRGGIGSISCTGWTALSQGLGSSAGDTTCAWFYKIAAGTETSVTLSWGASYPYESVAAFMEFSGLATTSVLDGTVAEVETYLNDSWPASAVSAGERTPTVAGGISIGIGGHNAAGSLVAFTWSTGWTKEQDANSGTYNPRLTFGRKIYSDTTALNPALTVGNPENGYVAHALFKAPVVAKNVSRLLCLGVG